MGVREVADLPGGRVHVRGGVTADEYAVAKKVEHANRVRDVSKLAARHKGTYNYGWHKGLWRHVMKQLLGKVRPDDRVCDGRDRIPRPIKAPETPLDGYSLGADELKLLATDLGISKTGLSITQERIRVPYVEERRLVTSRNVKEVQRDMIVQHVTIRHATTSSVVLRYVCWGLALVCAAVAVATVVPTAGVRPSPVYHPSLALRVEDTAATHAAQYAAYASGVRNPVEPVMRWRSVTADALLPWWRGTDESIGSWVTRLIQPLWAWLGSARGPEITIGTKRWEPLRPIFAAFQPVETKVDEPSMLVYLTLLALSVGLIYAGMLLDHDIRHVYYVPHMVACALSEYATGTGPEAAAQNARLKLMRLSCLPVEDCHATHYMEGSEVVILSVLRTRDFFCQQELSLPPPESVLEVE
jgi:hypothetical protein